MENQNMETDNTVPSIQGSNVKKIAVLSILLTVALIGCGVLGWVAYSSSLDSAQNAKEAQAAKQEVAGLEKIREEMAVQAQSNDAIAESTASDKIIAEAKAYVAADSANGKVELRIAKQVGDFARVSVTTETSGFELILKKTNDEWVVVTSGQQAPAKDIVDRYEIPGAVL